MLPLRRRELDRSNLEASLSWETFRTLTPSRWRWSSGKLDGRGALDIEPDQCLGLDGNISVPLPFREGRTIQRSFIPLTRPPGIKSAGTERNRLEGPSSLTVTLLPLSVGLGVCARAVAEKGAELPWGGVSVRLVLRFGIRFGGGPL